MKAGIPAAWSYGRPRGPDLLQLHAAWPERYPFLLESCSGPGPEARFDILFGFPGETLEATTREAAEGFFERLDARCAAVDRASAGPDLPFCGGWFVYLGYESGTALEPGVRWPDGATGGLHAMATRIPLAIVRDRASGEVWITHEAGAGDLVARVREDLDRVPPLRTPAPVACALREDPAQPFLDGVARIKEYIRAGDVYQVNLSRAWQADLPAGTDAAAVFAALRSANPAPFAACVRLGPAMAIVSSSPERLVQVRDGEICTRPIAGTYPRGRDEAQDARWSRELLAHPKERAEHVMLIDLERNDLGRVCETGSVRVSELMGLETYTHVHHIVSEVRGRLRPGTCAGQVLRAVFPGGTITGCPKVRCMQIIAEIEGAARGAYTGAVGYVSDHGRMDFNILIRTIVLRAGLASWRAGAGIVADSDPARELEETRAKARGMARALGEGSPG